MKPEEAALNHVIDERCSVGIEIQAAGVRDGRR